MAGKGEDTRERILDAAQGLVLKRGFSGVSVDQVIDSLGMTKGAFFHHFKNKGELAKCLIERYARMDNDFFYSCLKRADALSNDPLQQVLIMVGLYMEEYEGLEEPYPGCLLASYVYEMHQFNKSIIDVINTVFLVWRRELMQRFAVISRQYPPSEDIDLESLADNFIVIIEGAFILAKSLGDPDIVVKQLYHYKHYLELVFAEDRES